MFRYLLLIALIPAIVLAQTPFRTCTGGRRPPTAIRVPGCNAAPCTVAAGSIMSGQADFTAPNGAITLRPYVWVMVGPFHHNYQISADQMNACNHLSGAACPLGINQFASYDFRLTVTPGVSGAATIELSLLDQTTATVWCALIDLSIP